VPTAEPTTDVRQHILEIAHPLLLKKGFTAVGLAEVLEEAQVPKGSFYHYFRSKEAFGEALLEAYFTDLLQRTNRLLTGSGTAAKGLFAFFQDWCDCYSDGDAQGRCLAVKLGAEVSDLSEPMRAILKRGTADIIARLAEAVAQGRADGSLPRELQPEATAASLYQTWLGASLLAKISRDQAPLRRAMLSTRRMLAGKQKD